MEWFLLERHSPSLFGVPVERLLERLRERADEAVTEHVASLLDSFTGIFEVGEVLEGEGLWLRDLAGLGHYALAAPEGSVHLRQGDLLVGRLFPVGDGLHTASYAAALFRDAGLSRALEADLQRVRDESGKRVLHVSQAELERMFWGAGRRPEPADPVGAARDALAAAGLSPDRVDELLARLSRAPCDPDRAFHGAGDALGEILDELAFETQVDLDLAREHLTRAWSALSSPAPPSRAEGGAASAEPRTDRRAAVEAFARGREAGVDLEILLADLERDLALSPGDEPEAEEDTPAPDFPGVVGAMVDEFLWEVGRDDGERAAARYACLSSLSDYGARIGVLEGLDSTELLRFTAFWIHEQGVLAEGPERARELLDALDAFCRWAEEAHELPLRADFAPTLARLRESLPRIADLNRSLPPPPPGETGELYEVREDASGRFGGVRDRHGRDHTASPEPGLADRLRPGDRLRGAISLEGHLTIFRCYPPEAAGLQGG